MTDTPIYDDLAEEVGDPLALVEHITDAIAERLPAAATRHDEADMP